MLEPESTLVATSSCRRRRRRALMLQPDIFCWNRAAEKLQPLFAGAGTGQHRVRFCWNRQKNLLEPARFFAASIGESCCYARWWGRVLLESWMLFAGTGMCFCCFRQTNGVLVFGRDFFAGGHGGPSGRRRQAKAVTHGDAATTVAASWNRLACELQSYDRSMG